MIKEYLGNKKIVFLSMIFGLMSFSCGYSQSCPQGYTAQGFNSFDCTNNGWCCASNNNTSEGICLSDNTKKCVPDIEGVMQHIR